MQAVTVESDIAKGSACAAAVKPEPIAKTVAKPALMADRIERMGLDNFRGCR